jgi:hypothetical protein
MPTFYGNMVSMLLILMNKMAKVVLVSFYGAWHKTLLKKTIRLHSWARTDKGRMLKRIIINVVDGTETRRIVITTTATTKITPTTTSSLYWSI